jgi:hypothetical protein
MKVTLNLAGTYITINFIGEAARAMPMCRIFFRDFLHQDLSKDADVTVRILKHPIGRNPDIEQLVPAREIAAWLQQLPENMKDFELNEKTTCSSYLDGLLLFNPLDISGRIYLLKSGSDCLGPLYRLFWIYFAQVLGEKKACFMHAAGLVKNQKGYLFLGDSGAGKSTLARKCSDCGVLSDDSPIFRKINNKYHIFPSPYHQMNPSNGLIKKGINTDPEVKNFYFLQKDERLFLEKVPKKKAFAMILQRHVLFFPHLSTRAKSILFDIFFEACDILPAYFINFYRCEDVLSTIADG